MSNHTSPFKGGLTASGPSFADKAKLQARRPTPDSDVLASSDDDHAPPPRAAPGNLLSGRRPSTGWLQDIQPNRKFSLPSVSLSGNGSQPTTPSIEVPQQSRPTTSAFPWNTNSFSTTPSGTRLSKEVLPSPTSAQPVGDKTFPSPGTEGDDTIGFLLNQQKPVRKSVRSQSYSIGQADVENSPLGQFSARHRSSLRHRPSKPSHLGEGLSQLREDDADEVESSNSSEQGVRLPTTYWERDQNQGLLKQAAEQATRARHRATSTASPNSAMHRNNPAISQLENQYADYAVGDLEDTERIIGSSLVRRYSEHVAGGSGDASALRLEDKFGSSPWNVSPGTASNLAESLGRRHSFATYSSHTSGFQHSTLPTFAENEDNTSPIGQQDVAKVEDDFEPFDHATYFSGHGPVARAVNMASVSVEHPDPVVPRSTTFTTNPYAVQPTMGRPGRRLFVVTFKCSRAEIYYVFDNTGLEIRVGDLVIVEGDRGCDLGQVAQADVTLEVAKAEKKKLLDEHFRWLVMFSQCSLAGAKDEGMVGALARAHGFPSIDRESLVSMGGQGEQDTRPKMIRRLAQQHEINALRDKEGFEAKAKRQCALKAAEHKLPMEILDAEFQADYHKLTFFYYAENYVNFNDLVVDVFKAYKIRIWMSAVNPASVVNPAGTAQIQPPSAIGPGAILPSRTANNGPAVGPGFGGGSNRGAQQQQQARQNLTTPNTFYQHTLLPFMSQFAGYNSEWGLPQWNHQAQQNHQVQQNQSQQYSPYSQNQYQPGTGAYPNTSASASPMNYGAFYPPATYSGSPAFNNASSSSSYRGGYPATTAGPSYGYGNQYTTGTGGQGLHSTAPGYSGYSSAPYGNGYTATSGAYDPAFLAANMQNLNFRNN